MLFIKIPSCNHVPRVWLNIIRKYKIIYCDVIYIFEFLYVQRSVSLFPFYNALFNPFGIILLFMYRIGYLPYIPNYKYGNKEYI